MKNIDLVQEHDVAVALVPASIAAGTAGAVIDLLNYNGGVFDFNVAAGGNVAFKIQGSVDNIVAYADIAAATTVNKLAPTVTVNASNAGQLRIDPAYLPRYIKIFATPTAAVITSATVRLHKSIG